MRFVICMDINIALIITIPNMFKQNNQIIFYFVSNV